MKEKINLDDKIVALGNCLRAEIEEHGIIARCELLHRVYEAVREADLTESELDDLALAVGKNPAPGIFASIMSGDPIFSDFPRLDSFILLRNRIFHFSRSKNYSKEDFERAYQRFSSSAGELLALVAHNLADLVVDFMGRAGYKVSGSSYLSTTSESSRGYPHVVEFVDESGREMVGHVYPRIDYVRLEAHLGQEKDQFLIVPHEECLDPFVNFFRKSADSVEEAGLQIWVANMEEGSIDPFIGYTRDIRIYNQFKNPRLSEMVRATWVRR